MPSMASILTPQPVTYHPLSPSTMLIFSCHLALLYYPMIVTAAHAGFHVQYPWATRVKSEPERAGLQEYQPFCGDIIRNPQSFSGYSKTFLSFSGHAGDLVSVRYTTDRVPKKREDFGTNIVTDVPISSSGQLCIDIEMPTPMANPEYGVLLFEAENPMDGKLTWFCTDVKVKDIEARGEDHPAMCAKNNETLIPMPDDFL